MNSTETIDLSVKDNNHNNKITTNNNKESTEVDPLSTSIDTHDQEHNSVLDDFLDPGAAADGSHGHHVVNIHSTSPAPGLHNHSSTGRTDVIDSTANSSSESEPYRLTTERLAYILIGSCCALSILCLIVVAFSIRCRDMCDEYRAWKKAEKLAVFSNLRYTTQQHQPLGPGHPGHLSRHVMRINGRTGAIETIHDPYSSDSSTRPLNTNNSRPIFGPSCCCCPPAGVNGSNTSSNPSAVDSCPRGYFHPTPRGKLPFGAASSVHQFLPPRTVHVSNRNNSNHNNNVSSLSEEDEDDSDSILNPSIIEHSGPDHNSGNEACTCNDVSGVQDRQRNRANHRNHRQSNVHNHVNRHTQQQTGKKSNPSWIQSSILVDELHRKQQANIGKIPPASSKVIHQHHNHHNHRHPVSSSNKNNGNSSSHEQQTRQQQYNNENGRNRPEQKGSHLRHQQQQLQSASNKTNNNAFNSQINRRQLTDDQTRILWSGNDDRLI